MYFYRGTRPDTHSTMYRTPRRPSVTYLIDLVRVFVFKCKISVSRGIEVNNKRLRLCEIPAYSIEV